MQKEEWRSVVGYEGYYEVSSEGRVRRVKTGKILKYIISNNGYATQIIYKNKTPKNFRLHRLVATAFVPNPQNKPYVNHIDNNPMNNCVSNLEWCTSKENMDHCVKQGRRVNHIGEKNGQSKLTTTQVREILDSILPQKELSIIYGVSQSNISSIKTRLSWKNI